MGQTSTYCTGKFDSAQTSCAKREWSQRVAEPWSQTYKSSSVTLHVELMSEQYQYCIKTFQFLRIFQLTTLKARNSDSR